MMSCNLFQENKVTNELEAYLLGFFYADGCVSKYQNNAYRCFSVVLAQKDVDFLQWIADVINRDLGTSYTLKYVASVKAYKLSVYRKDFIQRIFTLGIINNKTYENNSYVFDNIPDNLKRHFIRGYFDGDGSISFYKPKNRCIVSIVSLNHSLLKGIHKWIYSLFNCGSLGLANRYTRLQFSGNISTKKVLDFLYSDANYFMDRKYQKYLMIPLRKYKNKYKGITEEKRFKTIKYNVTIYYNQTRHYLGSFLTLKEAVGRYNQEAIKNNVQTQEYIGEGLYYD